MLFLVALLSYNWLEIAREMLIKGAWKPSPYKACHSGPVPRAADFTVISAVAMRSSSGCCHKVDDERIDLIETIFRNLGFKGPDAHIRARVTYYNQVGYYALAVHETRPARRRLSSIYTLVLAGREF